MDVTCPHLQSQAIAKPAQILSPLAPVQNSLFHGCKFWAIALFPSIASEKGKMGERPRALDVWRKEEDQGDQRGEAAVKLASLHKRKRQR